MLSVHLQQMVAGSNGPASCVEDLSEHLYHAQVHLMRSTTECEDISTTEVFSGHAPFIQLAREKLETFLLTKEGFSQQTVWYPK